MATDERNDSDRNIYIGELCQGKKCIFRDLSFRGIIKILQTLRTTCAEVVPPSVVTFSGSFSYFNKGNDDLIIKWSLVETSVEAGDFRETDSFYTGSSTDHWSMRSSLPY